MSALSILMFASAYLLGSISSAILVCKLFGLGDPRLQGSRNPGATNVFRIGGRLPATLVLVFDVLKGTLPVWLSYRLGLVPIHIAFVAVTACLGHMFPLFFSFRGGKAVATALGALLPLGFSLTAILIGIWITVSFIGGYSSLASIITFALAPLVTYLFRPEYVLPVAILSTLIVLRHKQNILRLLYKQETKIRDKNKTKD